MTTVEAHDVQISPLSAHYQQELIDKNLWRPSCPVSLSRLRDVTVAYYDFENKPHLDGHIIVLDAVAPQTALIFTELFKMKFPIHSVKPSSDFMGNDDLSMEANNSSAFNCRDITGGSIPSLHSFGVAIDINPMQNPYLFPDPTGQQKWQILPTTGKAFEKRHPQVQGMVEPIVDLFKQQGFFEWGGHWRRLIDYHHFQPSRLVANLLAGMSPEDAIHFFAAISEHPARAAKLTEDQFGSLLELYQKDPHHFTEKVLLN